jgi:Mce-associated membrane protein
VSADENEDPMTETTLETQASRPRPRPRPYPHPPEDAPAAAEPASALEPASPPDSAPVEPASSLEPASSAQSRRSRLRVALIVTAALIVVLGFVAANVWLFTIRSANSSVERARVAALAVARTRIPSMLSYSYNDISSYVAHAPANTTGDFRKDFTQLVTSVIEPAAKQQHITTKATVKSVGIIDAHKNSVVVLVMIDQTTTSDSAKGGRIDGSRVRVTMLRAGNTWLVDDMTPV